MSNKGSNGSRKRDYGIIIILVIGFGITFFAYQWLSPDIGEEITKTQQELNATRTTVNATSAQVNLTQAAVINISENQETGFQNQKVLAKGINELGSIVIGEVEDIKEKTNLIDDIKFNTEQILNKTVVKNITLTNLTG